MLLGTACSVRELLSQTECRHVYKIIVNVNSRGITKFGRTKPILTHGRDTGKEKKKVRSVERRCFNNDKAKLRHSF